MDCRYCGNDAGFLRRKHKDCERTHDDGISEMHAIATRAALGMGNNAAVSGQMRDIAGGSYISQARVPELMLSGFENAVDHVLDDHLLTEEEEWTLLSYIDEVLEPNGVPTQGNGQYNRLENGRILREIQDGTFKPPVELRRHVPFNLQKTETLYWVVNGCRYYEEKVERERIGGSSGASVRVARGVYVRTGSFKSRTVERVVRRHIATGMFGVTDRHLYFVGGSSRFRVRLDRIVAFDALPDGIGIMREAASAKPQEFIVGDGWFVTNLVTYLASN